MINYRTNLVFWSTLLLYLVAFAQEICDNGIDDDNDNYVDCYDFDCNSSNNCAPAFFIEDSLPCVMPPEFQFAMEEVWETPFSVLINDLNQILVADFDSDGSIEIFAGGQNNSFISATSGIEMYIFDGVTGNVEQTFFFPDKWDGQTMPAVGDIDNDGLGEIILSSRQSSSQFSTLYVYEHNGILKYAVPVPNFATNRTNDWALADFDQNGTVEIYTRGIILDGASGNILVTLPETVSGSSPILPYRCSVAADLLPDSFCTDCQGLELIIGNKIFSINLVSGNAVLQSIAADFGVGFTSIADWDLDGDLDVLVYDGEFGTNFKGFYVWDGQTPLILGSFSDPGALIGARVCIGNVDDDPYPEAIYKTVTNLYVVDNDFDLIWQTSIDENGTGMTPATVFDFNGDGKMEVIHRDENSLEVYTGDSGQLLDEKSCYSITGYEVVVIADSNNDGEADILTTCNNSPSTISNSNEGHIRMFHSAASPWMPARNVWNQQGYFNVNINNNLSIPVQQQLHHLPFPAGSNYYPLNLFLAQYSPVNQTLAANNLPDAAITITAACANGNVTYEICNQGAATLPQQLPLAMYNGNPANAGTLLLDVFFLPDSLPAGICASLQLETGVVTGNSVYLVVNDGGNLLPPFTPDDLAPIATTPECEMENNIAQAIFPPPPYLETVVNCTNNLPAVSLQVSSYQTGSLFTWSSGQQTDVAVALQNGNYCVTVTNANGNCASVLCHDVEIDPIVPPVISGDTSIASGGNALLQLTGAYNGYQWSTGQNTQWITVTQPGNYAVTVTDLNGCTALASTTLTLYNNPLADTLLYSYVLSNAFTPNHDGVNDTFTALAYGQVDGFALFIYNRWGNKVFESHHIETNWNGMYKNTPCPIGTYAYYGFITFANGKTHNFQGNVTLLR
ncbi:hypothetical protein C7N43_12655 [Sphingobacteriales bacterium UPWRP_1]|nr:hypothetical protein B6N25_04040 [Sphingobacteriales bacterium TSM_CSS]PSJ76692.1 hypothetical protein C7N43_12655 [Sphingobacteriales bacterium UPWRP_1]